MQKFKKIIAQLQACAEMITEAENATDYKGCLIDAEAHVASAIEHIARHARNEQARATK